MLEQTEDTKTTGVRSVISRQIKGKFIIKKPINGKVRKASTKADQSQRTEGKIESLSPWETVGFEMTQCKL